MAMVQSAWPVRGIEIWPALTDHTRESSATTITWMNASDSASWCLLTRERMTTCRAVKIAQQNTKASPKCIEKSLSVRNPRPTAAIRAPNICCNLGWDFKIAQANAGVNTTANPVMKLAFDAV